MTTERKVHEANARPCAACPWRTENHGKRHPHGWYTKKNLRRLWAKIRRGDSMTCHPTDPTNLVPDGTKPVPDGTQTRECAGALRLVQIELKKFEADPKTYDMKKGLTKTGLNYWALARCAFAGTFVGGEPMPVIDSDVDVAHP